ETKQREQQRLAQQEAIAGNGEAIFASAQGGMIGNPEGHVTVVEFFDYDGAYCKRALAEMDGMLCLDPRRRLGRQECPILGPDSQKAHVVSMAFRALHPEKYPEFHRRLLGSTGRADEAKALAIALDLGADEAAVRREMTNPEITDAFNRTYELANT